MGVLGWAINIEAPNATSVVLADNVVWGTIGADGGGTIRLHHTGVDVDPDSPETSCDFDISHNWLGPEEPDGHVNWGVALFVTECSGTLHVFENTIVKNMGPGIVVDFMVESGDENRLPSRLDIAILRNFIGTNEERTLEMSISGWGIWLDGCDGTPGQDGIADVQILGNTIVGESANGFYIGGVSRFIEIGSYEYNNETYQTELSGLGGWAVYIQSTGSWPDESDECSHISVSDCLISDILYANAAVKITGALSHITIAGNRFEHVMGAAIDFQGASTHDVRIVDNTFAYCHEGIWNYGAIYALGDYVYTGNRDILVSGNDFLGVPRFYDLLEKKWILVEPVLWHDLFNENTPPANYGIVPPTLGGEIWFEDGAWHIPFVYEQSASFWFREGSFRFECYAVTTGEDGTRAFQCVDEQYAITADLGEEILLYPGEDPNTWDDDYVYGEFVTVIPEAALPDGFNGFALSVTWRHDVLVNPSQPDERTEERENTSEFHVILPPTVTGVTVGSNNAYGALVYEEAIPAVENGADQIKVTSIPHREGITWIRLTFDQEVDVSVDDLAIVGGGGFGSAYTVYGFDYDSEALTATWYLDNSNTPTVEWIRTDQVELVLSDTVVSVANGLALDGDWVNPTDYLDNSGNSTFPSGDVVPGGDFVFHFAHPSRADFDLSGWVNLGDMGTFSLNWGAGPGATWAQGDANGDGWVNLGDLGIISLDYNKNFTNWPTGELAMAGPPRSDNQRTLAAARDAVFAGYSLEDVQNVKRPRSRRSLVESPEAVPILGFVLNGSI
ncbi:MAG: right-handed parallel beta-helix repeat-containing protein [Pirellulales bacterium]|nr:right-handed parallel beta-helix repeat-containing protein [Pirellulales bacterium]